MFFLSEIEHTLRLPPYLLNLPLDEAIKGQLDSLFLDKVIEKLGLCVSVYDIRSIDGGFVFPGDGASTYTVKFRLVMFRPFVGEIISARLKDSTEHGLQFGEALRDNWEIMFYTLSLGFFDDIYVPVPLLPNPNHSEPDPERKNAIRWVWEYDGESFAVDGTDEIRFRVHDVSYPPKPLEQPKDTGSEQETKPFAPMVITASIDGDGLGPVSWW